MPATRLQKDVDARKAQRKAQGVPLNTSQSLCQLIVGRIKATGVKEPELLESVGISRTTFWRWKKDFATVSVRDFLAICEHLQIPIQEVRDAIHY